MNEYWCHFHTPAQDPEGEGCTIVLYRTALSFHFLTICVVSFRGKSSGAHERKGAF